MSDKKYECKYGTSREIGGRIVYSDIRDEIRAFKFYRNQKKS